MAPKRDSPPVPTPAEEAAEIGGDVNPYPVDQFAKAREEAKQQADRVGSPMTAPLSEDSEDD